MAPEKQEAQIESMSVMVFVAGDSAVAARSGGDAPQPSGSVTAFRPVPDHDDEAAPAALGTAASLPLPGLHVRDGLEAMVTGLSSPSFHNTLASPQKTSADKACAAADCGSAAATAAATSAFAISMVWPCGPAVHVHAHGAGSGLGFPSASGSPERGIPLENVDDSAESVLVTCCLCRQQAPGGSGPCCTAQPPTWRGPAAADACLPTPPRALTTRRGLYEGTVRGGSVRNTWIYLHMRNSAG